MKTVESYQAHIKEKLSLRNARELVQHAIEWNVSEKNRLKVLHDHGTHCVSESCPDLIELL